MAWRNGLGALLIALVGFGLVKGRSDITQLAAGWAGWVGVLLLLALVAGATGALLLLRAAHGRPTVTEARQLSSIRATDHSEALASAVALRLGIAATLGCTILLVAAVGVTWYGPEKAAPAIQVGTQSGPLCGTVVRLTNSTLLLRTNFGLVTIDLATAETITAVEKCL